MLLDHNQFVVKSQTKGFSGKKSFQIEDGDSGEVLGTVEDATGFFPSLLGAVKFEVRDAADNSLVFTLSRSGFLFKKDQVLDGQGQLVGSFKAKRFSLSSGYNVLNNHGDQLAEIKGKWLTNEYKFVTPDGSTELGSVSRTWGGLAKSLTTGDNTFGVQIAP